MTTIYTIGHSNHTLEHFLSLLRQHCIATLVDVRSHPYSRWVPHFRRDELSRALAGADVDYVFLGRELGGKLQGSEYRDERGRVDYVRRAQAPDFQAGVERLRELAGRRRVAIMCAEEDPERCHRRFLVTPALRRRGDDVRHIRGDGREQSDDDLAEGSSQLGLFEE